MTDEYGIACAMPVCRHPLRSHQAQEGMCQLCNCMGWERPINNISNSDLLNDILSELVGTFPENVHRWMTDAEYHAKVYQFAQMRLLKEIEKRDHPI